MRASVDPLSCRMSGCCLERQRVTDQHSNVFSLLQIKQEIANFENS